MSGGRGAENALGAAVAHMAHNYKMLGSTPGPATVPVDWGRGLVDGGPNRENLLKSYIASRVNTA